MSLILAIAGPLVGLVGVITAIVIYRKSREHRQLTYDVSETPQLLSVSRAIRGDVEVTYQGRPVTDLAGATVKLVSTGNRSVQIPRASDYETPVTIDFGEEAEILGEPRITETVPENLAASLRVDSGKVVVEGVLLNPGHRISVFTLLSGVRDEVRVSAHIRDVELAEARESFPLPRFMLYFFAVVFVAGTILVSLGLLGQTTDVFTEATSTVFLGFGSGLLFPSIVLFLLTRVVGRALSDLPP